MDNKAWQNMSEADRKKVEAQIQQLTNSGKIKLVNGKTHISTKTQNNDLCPCGSGKKFKRCCKKN